MRTALIAAIAPAENGMLRADLRLGGRSVLAWQVELLRALGAERFLCLCHGATGEVLRLQHLLESEGATFHALRGFAAIPALVRADDQLIILRDGLLPDAALVRRMVGDGPGWTPLVASLPADHSLSLTHPDDFERIDAARHWAGLLLMRGAPVQQLADFPADAEPVSVLLRLALQGGTPFEELDASALGPEVWLLADSAATVAAQERSLIARGAAAVDWRAPLAALAELSVRNFARRGIVNGAGAAAGLALLMLIAAAVTAGLGIATGGLAFAAFGAFAGSVSASFAALTRRVLRAPDTAAPSPVLARAVDGLAAATLLLALGPPVQWGAPLAPLAPLAVCGPLLIGLARLAARRGGTLGGAFWSDRASLMAILALAAGFGLLAHATALIALTVLVALQLRGDPD